MAAKETERQLPVLLEGGPHGRGGLHAHAVVYAGERSVYVPLEEGRTVVLGREAEADVVVDAPTASRRHLALRWSAGELTARDCGSTNGTFVDGRRLEGEVVLHGGETITMGEALVAVAVTTPLTRTGRIVTVEAFEERFRAELVRAARLGRSLVLAHLAVEGEAEAAEGSVDRLVAALPNGALATVEGPACRALVPDARAAAVRFALEELLARLAVLGLRLRHGLAEFPRDGGDAAALEAVARASLAGSPSAGEGAPPASPPGGPVAVDPVSVRLLALVDRVAGSDGTVLLLGETGVGKDVLAREIHRRSRRAEGPFVHVNCGAIPSGLFAREMLGHEKGAYTGACDRGMGLFEAASGGTLFLDEIAEIPLGEQARLLRAIEHREITRIGGVEPIPVDIRIVAATNRDLEGWVAQGLFREDLLYRLGVLTLLVPALRDRRRDVPPLARRFFDEVAVGCGRADLVLSEEAVAVLERYDWPGNVRELRNVVERAALLASGPVVTDADALAVLYGEPLRSVDLAGPATLRDLVEEVERHAVVQALEACGGNQGLAADRLGVSRRTLIYKMRRYGIEGPGRGAR